jgi:hypothetical protein
MNTTRAVGCKLQAERLVILIGSIIVLFGLICFKVRPPERKGLPESARWFTTNAPTATDLTSVTRTNFMGATSINGFSRKDVIDLKLKDYQERMGQFHANMYWQVGLAFMCLLLIGRYSTNVNLPVLGIKFPARLLLFIVPVVMCYLWLQFGYSLESIIERRLALVSCMAEAGDAPTFADQQNVRKGNASTLDYREGLNEFGAIRQRSSLLPLLADSGFVDGWFVSFWPWYTIDSSHEPSNKRLFSSVFGLMLGFVHACMFVTLLAGCQELKEDTKQEGNARQYLAWALLLAVGIVMTFSHYHFAWPTKNPNNVQPLIWVTTIMGIILLSGYEKRRRALANAQAAITPQQFQKDSDSDE